MASMNRISSADVPFSSPLRVPEVDSRPVVVMTVGSLGMYVRNLLRTDIYHQLQASDVNLVLLTPLDPLDDILQEVLPDEAHVEPIEPYKPSWLESKFRAVANTMFVARHPYSNFELNEQRLREAHYLKYLGRLILRRILGTSKRRFHFFHRLSFACSGRGHYRALFQRLRPRLLFSTAPFGTGEIPILRAARDVGVPIVTMIGSWDHIPARGVLPTRFDRVIVWNRLMKQVMVEFYGYTEEEVFVAGVPQFDIYAHRNQRASRQEFFQKIQADPDKKLITYTTCTPSLNPYQPEIVEILYDAIQAERFSLPTQLLVRFHPRDEAERYVHLQNRPGLLFDRPGREEKRFGDGWNPTETDMRHLADTMFHSDVVINTSSTTTLDAIALDTPVVCIGFDGYKPLPYLQSCRRYYEYIVFRPIVHMGGARVAYDAEQLVGYVNDYLNNPGLDGPQRQRVREDFCYRIDGQAGRRIVHFLLESLASL